MLWEINRQFLRHFFHFFRDFENFFGNFSGSSFRISVVNFDGIHSEISLRTVLAILSGISSEKMLRVPLIIIRAFPMKISSEIYYFENSFGNSFKDWLIHSIGNCLETAFEKLSVISYGNCFCNRFRSSFTNWFGVSFENCFGIASAISLRKWRFSIIL